MKINLIVIAVVVALLTHGCAKPLLLDPYPPSAVANEISLNRTLRESVSNLVRSGEYDSRLCVTAQHVILNSSSDDFTVLLQRGEGSAFHTIQMGISSKARIVRVAMMTENSGPLGFDTYVACKMVNRERVNDELGLRLRGEDTSCRTVNELTYATALSTLELDELQRFLNTGKPLRFVDDHLTAGGGEWIPLALDNFIRDVAGEYLEVQAPSVRVPWDKSERVFYQGTQHCKLVTLAAMRRWMKNGGLQNAARLFPATQLACTAPAAATSKVGSCLFYFAPAGTSFCQDYTGTSWTAEAASRECAQRHANLEALNDAQNTYAGAGGVFDALTCAKREDVAPITGTCVFNCAAPDETLWQVSSVEAGDGTMARACDLFIQY